MRTLPRTNTVPFDLVTRDILQTAAGTREQQERTAREALLLNPQHDPCKHEDPQDIRSRSLNIHISAADRLTPAA